MMKIKKTSIMFLLPIFILGCSSGVYNKMDSSAPSFGPILVGMTRAEAEMHLGVPLLVTAENDGRYSTIYEYEIEKGAMDTIATDILDFLTAGIGVLIVSPVDRFNGSKHLLAIVYEMEDQYAKNDRVVAITERVKIVQEQ